MSRPKIGKVEREIRDWANSPFSSANLDEVAFVEDECRLTRRDLLNEELAQCSPLVRQYVRWLELHQR